MNRKLMVLMMANLAVSTSGGAVSARKESEGGQLANKEQELRDDKMKAEEQVPLRAKDGTRRYFARGAVADAIGSGEYSEIRQHQHDTEAGKLPPNLNDAERQRLETGNKEAGAAEVSGEKTGDERNARAPDRRLEVTDPEEMRKVDEKKVKRERDQPRARAQGDSTRAASRAGAGTTSGDSARTPSGANANTSDGPGT